MALDWFVTEKCKICPHCKQELQDVEIETMKIKVCTGCKKQFPIAFMVKV
jgi:uncharacterized protein YbaR (Trm112 family)